MSGVRGRRILKTVAHPSDREPETDAAAPTTESRSSLPDRNGDTVIALMITAATLMLVGAIVVSLERHRRLTPITALLTGLGTLAIVLGSITATVAAIDPATADVVPRGVTVNQLPERVTDFDLPTL